MLVLKGLRKSALNGDANFDGQVAFADFLVLSSNFDQPGRKWSDGDFDSNGIVQFADFLILSENFGRSAAVATSVPEPTINVLAVLGIALMVKRRVQL